MNKLLAAMIVAAFASTGVMASEAKKAAAEPAAAASAAHAKGDKAHAMGDKAHAKDDKKPPGFLKEHPQCIGGPGK